MRIVMTGATSGFGLIAAEQLLDEGHELVVGARTPAKAPPGLARATVLPLDLGDLDQVRSFAGSVEAGPAADVLLMNAGIQVINPASSAQGYELTFATNHLAHYLLARRLAPQLAAGGRVVFTASGVHDPAGKTGMPPPLHADARRLAFPANDPQHDTNAGTAGRRAYAASKLCNVMTARELAARLADARPDVAVMSYDPGFVPGTGLARDYTGVLRFLSDRVLPLTVFMSRKVSTQPVSGRLLAELAVSPAYAAARGDYYSVLRPELRRVEPSALARDAAACRRLWDDSAGMVGLAA